MKPTSYIGELSRTWRDLPIDLISRSSIARWAPIPLRLIVGYGFMEHGFAKLARGPEALPAILHALGVPTLLARLPEWDRAAAQSTTAQDLGVP
jgi:putative oxidoreductase